ncbi:MAG: hypothetical protein ACRCVX_01370 [Shewanella sp.]
MKTLFIATALLVTSLTTAAAPLEVSVHQLSYHTNREVTFNETNPGLGLGVAVTDTLAVEAGYYHNSYSKRTEYLMLTYAANVTRNVKLGVVVGAATGYEAFTGSTVTPMAAVHMEVAATNSVALVTRYVPPAPSQEQSSGVFTLSLKVAFK